MGLSVLHVSQPVDAGVARCAADFAADQAARGWRVAVACPPDGPLAGWLAAAGVARLDWRATRDPGPLVPFEVRRLRRLVRAFRPDVVHLHSSKAGLAGRLAVRGRVPTVFQPHAWSFEAAGGAVRAGAVAWERRAARWAGVIVCVSEAERARGEAAGIAARYAVVPNGVDLARWTYADDAARAAARAQLGIDPDEPVAVCVGRLARQKGQDVLLDAWPAVRRSVKGARLYLVGDGPDRARLAARGVAGVSFAGRRDDVPDWLAAADVVALPSRWEGMSLSVLEALARGRPVVATDVPGVRESVLDGTGAVVPVADPAALAVALADRLGDVEIARSEGLAARSVAEVAFDVTRTNRAIAQIYDMAVTRSDDYSG